MSKEKQIEEMAKILLDVGESYYGLKCDENVAMCEAYALYNAGYRKQSKGEWICEKEETVWSETLLHEHCSECGRKFTRTDKQVPINFCPNCGAKMKGGAE